MSCDSQCIECVVIRESDKATQIKAAYFSKGDSFVFYFILGGLKEYENSYWK